MNYQGPYKKLLGNSIAAMVSAVEVYNRPWGDYREETFSILLINSWELLLKAVISKGKGSIFYKKRRGEPYRTLNWKDAFHRVVFLSLWPKAIEADPVLANLKMMASYRDSAVHFYNERGLLPIMYALSQTSVMNFRDVAVAIFGKDLTSQKLSWQILPIGPANPIDPVAFMRGTSPGVRSRCEPRFPVLPETANLSDRVERRE